ncbi:MAG TPA: tetratricopeptide repeat protein, partial [Rhizomicrobium sp.]|nr:tetratricopeptide repeat protein [Rhizomicrobium sp.]
VSLDRAIALQPGLADAWNNRGVLLRVLARRDEALACYDQALALEPGHARAWNNRGVVLLELNRAEEALSCFEKSCALQPDQARAWIDRGAALHQLKRLEQALASVEQAIRLDADSAEAWSNRSVVLMAMNQPDQALVSVEQALSLSPDYENGWNNRASVLSELKRFAEAAESYREAVRLKPDHEFLFGHYLHAKLKVAGWEGLEADIAKCAAGVAEGAKLVKPFTLLNLTDDPALQHKAARIYTEAKHPRSFALGPMPPRAGRGKIRIGYYSADFHHHATCFLIAELLEAHDSSRFELFGFSFGPDEQDAMRQRVKRSFHQFLDVRGMADREIARLSRELGIDIAVDLKGHTQQARTGIFAEGAAPIQVQYLGYPGTMGADYIDYVIGDGTVIPPGAETDYSEKVVRLPHSYQPNDSRRKISQRLFTRAEAGLPKSGFVFCCFNNNQKILPDAFDSWMRILKAVEGSVLWLLPDNEACAQALRAQAWARGVDPERLIFAHFLPLDEHLARHKLADLFLDSWPYNAHTTASDALWAGLPVITYAGKSFASRVAASLLNAVGLPDLITNSREDFEALAIRLAREPAKLAAFRQTLADNRVSAPLFDGKRIARHLEKAYEAMHTRRLAGQPPGHIDIAP